MARQNKVTNNRLMTKVSMLYYIQNLRQQVIANKLHLSRPKVSRLLKEARDRGIVQINIRTSDSIFYDLESAIEEKYKLDEALICDTEDSLLSQNGDHLKKQIGILAANYLQRTLYDNEIIGITWGTTLQAMLSYLQPQAANHVHIIQATGSIGRPEAGYNAAELSRTLARSLNGRLSLLPAPGIISTVEARNVYLNEPNVKSTLELFCDITSAYVGIGSVVTSPVFKNFESIITKKMQEELINSGAVGDIALRFFDKSGTPIHTSLDEHLMGITLEELRNVKHVVGIAGGEDKLEAIHGALKGHYIDVLITDKTTANLLLNI